MGNAVDNLSRRRRMPVPPPEYDAQGRRLCRMCPDPVPDERLVFCSHRCRREWMVRHSPEFAGLLFRKLYGTMCSGCGQDEERQFEAYQQALAILKDRKLEHLLKPWRPYQLHHLRAVSDGGGSCGLENYVLACTQCHGATTSVQASERSARHRATGPWAASHRQATEYKLPILLRRADP